MRIHEIRTELPAAAVIERARDFFTLASTPCAAFTEQAGENYLKLFLEVGEIVIGAVPRDGGTLVRASASRGGHLLTRFLATLASPNDARQTLHRYQLHRARGARVEDFAIEAPAPVGVLEAPGEERLRSQE